MSFVKQCPSCGHSNPEFEFLCQRCGNDISAVDAQQPAEEESSSPIPPESENQVTKQKLCPKCGAENAAFAILCSQEGCGEEIEGVEIVAARHSKAPQDPRQRQSSPPEPNVGRTVIEPRPPCLFMSVGERTFECREGDVLGREGTLASDLFFGIPTVSGRHVAFSLREGQWHVVNLPLQAGRTEKNITCLDGRGIPIGQSLPLTSNHILKLSTRCEVHLRVVSQ